VRGAAGEDENGDGAAIDPVDILAAVNLGRLDLNLLVALDALLQQRSVTRAAVQMGLGQPALSASLARLRRHFGDELLHRVGNEYRLTPLAVELRARTAVALSGVDRVFSAQPGFDPASASREFRLLMTDYAIAVLGGRCADILAAEAPRARLRMSLMNPHAADLAEQVLLDADVLLMPHGFITDLPHLDLFRDDWVCVVAAENREVGDVLTREQLATAPWVVSFHGPTASTPALRQLRMAGVEPTVAVVIENFMTIPGLVAGSGRVALLQRRLADLMLADDPRVRVVGCSIELGTMVEAMWWSPVNEADPEHGYLRDVVRRAAAT
jgi:DNA-binding transcriptional LysR family regulator